MAGDLSSGTLWNSDGGTRVWSRDVTAILPLPDPVFLAYLDALRHEALRRATRLVPAQPPVASPVAAPPPPLRPRRRIVLPD